MALGIDQIEFFSPTFTSLLVFGLTFVVGSVITFIIALIESLILAGWNPNLVLPN
jgi:hypothetical protein